MRFLPAQQSSPKMDHTDFQIKDWKWWARKYLSKDDNNYNPTSLFPRKSWSFSSSSRHPSTSQYTIWRERRNGGEKLLDAKEETAGKATHVSSNTKEADGMTCATYAIRISTWTLHRNKEVKIRFSGTRRFDLDKQGRIRFCALILDFDEKYIFDGKCTIYSFKMRYYWPKIRNMSPEYAKNLIFRQNIE